MKNFRICMRASFASGVAAVAMMTLATGAAAQSSAAPATTAEEVEAQGDVNDIVVTARRRAERLQDVPTAITALTSESLSRLNVVKTEDLNQVAAGLNVYHQGDRQRVIFNLRGQGQANNGGEPGVQIYFDEVPLLNAGLDFYDLGQIEVLRGPQGTLFGRNTSGGAVRIRPKLPSNQFDGYLEGRLGNLDAKDIEGAINIPVVEDKLAVRVSGARIRRDGYITNIVSGQDLNDEHTDNVRAQILFTPSPKFDVRALFSYRHFDTNAMGIIPNQLNVLGNPPVDALFAQAYQLALDSDFRKVRSNVAASQNGKSYFAEGVASYHFNDDLTARYIFGYVRSEGESNYDLDASVIPLLEPVSATHAQIWTNEVQLLGKAFDSKLDWIIGGYYEKSKTFGPGSVLTLNAFGAISTTQAKLNGSSKAIFAQGSYNFTPELSLTAGARLTHDKRNGLTGRGAGTALPVLNNRTQFKKSQPTWTLSLNYKPTRDLLVYVANRRGYKSGGINAFINPPLPTGFNEEKVTDFELGVKSTFRTDDITHRLNIAAFYGRFAKTQSAGVTVDPNTNGPATLIYDSGPARSRGAEVEYNAAFGKAFDFSVQYAYLKFKYVDYRFFDGTRFSGVQPTTSPKHKLTIVGTAYAPVDESVGSIYLIGKYSYQSREFLSQPNVVNAANGAFSTVDASLNWDGVMGTPFDASAFVQNATDKRYFIGTGFPNFAMMDRATPRTYGVKLRFRFGASAD